LNKRLDKIEKERRKDWTRLTGLTGLKRKI